MAAVHLEHMLGGPEHERKERTLGTWYSHCQKMTQLVVSE
jgi:hypothetical protein